MTVHPFPIILLYDKIVFSFIVKSITGFKNSDFRLISVLAGGFQRRKTIFGSWERGVGRRVLLNAPSEGDDQKIFGGSKFFILELFG